MADMKLVENKLQLFDVNAKPSITHTQIDKLKKVILMKNEKKKKFLF